MANQPADGLVPVYVSGGDTVSARMPYLNELASPDIGRNLLLVITRQGGAQELYDSSTHVVICDPVAARIQALENDLRGALAFLRVLDRLRPTCVICHDETADRQTIRGPACSDCVGDLPDDGADPERPETWAFPGPEEFGPEPAR